MSAAPIMEGPPGAETQIDGRRYLYFGGTSYLGLAGHPEVIEAACEAARRYGIHTATSRRGFGTNPATAAVERLAAEFFATEEAFYFVSGYVGNHILVQALANGAGCPAGGRFDVILADESAHFSVYEAARLGGVPVLRFCHRDPEDLQRQLQRRLSPGQHPLVMTDGVSPMSGAVAPIDQYLRVLSNFRPAGLLIDDAHGMGTIGEHGRGTLEHLGLWGPQVNAGNATGGAGTFVCGTLSKALGGFGGIVPGSSAFVERTRAASHYFDGASALPAPAAGASAKALEIVQREPELRSRLRENSTQLRTLLRGLGLAVEDWPTPIIGLTIGNAANMRRIHGALRSAGILVPYVAEYVGAGDEGRLRIAVFATHTPEMLARLAGELGKVL